jgi:hypothetical protein
MSLVLILTAVTAFSFASEPSSSSVLAPETWVRHLTNDIAPFWTSPDAMGSPRGNFPTLRKNDGTPAVRTDRRPRMMGRQIYACSAAYILTGEASYLEAADDGLRFLLAHARDSRKGGWQTLLDKDGNPKGNDYRYSQDAAYAAMGPAVYYFVTRDPAARETLVSNRNEIFNPRLFWDETNRRVRNAILPSMDGEAPAGKDNGWELVSQLDQVNGWLLLTQPVMGGDDSARFGSDIRTLLAVITNRFWKDGLFYGRSSQLGNLDAPNTDFGHVLKTYWMLLLAGSRLGDAGFTAFALSNAPYWLSQAYDRDNGRWALKMEGSNSVRYGSSWWIYAECDQIAATFALQRLWTRKDLATTASNWLADYVDRPYGEVFRGIDRSGNPDRGLYSNELAKCNEWKNGFHSSEHALVLYIASSALAGKPVALYFAVPPDDVKTFTAKPYLFEGDEISREDLGGIAVGGRQLHRVRVTFDHIR